MEFFSPKINSLKIFLLHPLHSFLLVVDKKRFFGDAMNCKGGGGWNFKYNIIVMWCKVNLRTKC